MKRRHPLVSAVLFVVGLGFGFMAGCVIAALFAPAAGQDFQSDARRALAGGDSGSVPSTFVGALKVRFRRALDAALLERTQSERDLRERHAKARLTGKIPD